MKTKYRKPSKKKFETSCPSECFTLESGGSICSSKASKLENPSVLIQSLDSAASPSQSTIKIYIPWLFKLIIWKWKVKFKLHLFTILLSCRFSSKFILNYVIHSHSLKQILVNGFGFAHKLIRKRDFLYLPTISSYSDLNLYLALELENE